MELKKLILNNIGPYIGHNEIQLKSSKQKNITLIGGKNGAGKTTFLNSVRLALYGPLAYGYKTTSKEYLSKVSSLFNNQALKTKQSTFYIQIYLSLVENFQKYTYSIKREWRIKNSNIIENVYVKKNDRWQNDIETDNFFEYLRTTLPPSLLELCFFDGEDIIRLNNENKLSEYLEDLSKKLFNLDLFCNLEKDIITYISQSSKTENEEKYEIERSSLENEINIKNNRIKILADKLEKLKLDLKNDRTRYEQVKNEFSIHGGLVFEERENIQKEMAIIEQNRKQRNDSMKRFIGNYLPFYLAYPIFKKLVVQLKDEEDFHISENLKKKINGLDLKNIFEETNLPLKENQIHILRKNLIKNLTSTKNVNVIFNASKSEVSKINNMFNLLNFNKFNQFIKMIHDDKRDLSRLRLLKEKIKDNETTVEFEEMIMEMEKLNQNMVNIKNNIESLTTEIENAKIELNNLNKRFEKINNELYKIYKSKSSFSISEKVLRISKRFQSEQLRKKLKDAEFLSSKMFKDLLRKKTFINRIEICPKHFQITIYDNDYNIVNKNNLSAGEKELLILSIIWGMIKSSKKQLPFVFDTLFGRLDLEHKHSVITKLIPKFGDQIIILATDSEIDGRLYQEITPYLANEYTLNYDIVNKKTVIETHFFNHNQERW